MEMLTFRNRVTISHHTEMMLVVLFSDVKMSSLPHAAELGIRQSLQDIRLREWFGPIGHVTTDDRDVRIFAI
jgi:hypothetical protein